MGDLERWAAFSLGLFSSHLSDSAFVQGDFGAAGNGDLTLMGHATIDGDVYFRSNGALNAQPGTTITGSQFHNQDALLDNDVAQAMAASNAAAALHATRAKENVDLRKNQRATFNGAPGETVVLNLQSFQMSGNSTLTLQGSANTAYIINVRGQFSLADRARIILSGGLSWNDVLFNVRGRGSQVSLSGDSQFNGVLLADARMVRLRDRAILNGEAIGGRFVLQGSSQVIHPAVVSP
jgi:choice-of-anchor A domain-containing protein